MKEELEEIYLRNHSFAFSSPERLNSFLDQLSEHQMAQVRRITFIISVSIISDLGRVWLGSMEQLPGNITTTCIVLTDSYYHGTDLPLSRVGTRKLLDVVDVLKNRVLRQLPHARISIEGDAFDRFNPSVRAVFNALIVDRC